jgi:Nucleotide-binding protein implicated in inhibition of septum formation
MLEKLFDRYQIILSSGSPRRQQFLKEANIPYLLQLLPVEEIYPKELQREEITAYLSDLNQDL